MLRLSASHQLQTVREGRERRLFIHLLVQSGGFLMMSFQKKLRRGMRGRKKENRGRGREKREAW